MAENTERQRVPSPYKLNDNMAVVMVDQWGHEGEFHRGDIVKLNELDSSKYDAKSAVDRGVVRMLTEAEVNSPPTTRVLDANGELDENHARATRYHAGIIEGVDHLTVTTGSGPAEPSEFAKPTIESGAAGEAPYPVKVVGSAEEVRQPVPQTERVASGMAYVPPEESSEQRVSRRGRTRE